MMNLHKFGMRVLALAFVLLLLGARVVHAADVRVAVAANFTAPMQMIAQAFEQETGHKVHLAFGSTGGFYAQIKNGAPFQVFMAADEATPTLLVQEGWGVANSRAPYAMGKLVLWSAQAGLVDDKGDVLKSARYQRLALANPKLAPYGAAALETLRALGLVSQTQSKWVQGENVAQTYQFVASQNAQLGFVSLSQVLKDGKIAQGSAWVVPAHLYSPIRQDMLLLTSAQNDAAARALLQFMRSDKAQTIIRSFGYGLP